MVGRREARERRRGQQMMIILLISLQLGKVLLSMGSNLGRRSSGDAHGNLLPFTATFLESF